MSSFLDACVLIDSDGRIVYITESLARLRRVNAERAVGQLVQDVFTRTEIDKVLLKGLEEKHVFWKERDDLGFIVSRIPVFKDGNIIGVWAYVEQVLVPEQKSISYFKSLPSFSPRAKKAKQQVASVAPFDTTVMLCGETGVGKEYFARAIHEMSERRKKPFVMLNCAAVSEALAESELFGYDKGAFTGASSKGHKGRFEQADGGTLFLDEVGELSLSIQSKLLRVLQENAFQRVGAEKSTGVDVRVIAATNRNLKNMVKEGQFRLDLYYRLSVVNIAVPPLREQQEDIVILVQNLWEKLCYQYQRYSSLTEDAYNCIRRHGWPGNIRELKNTLERVLILNPEGHIDSTLLVEQIDDIDQLMEISVPVSIDNVQELQELLESCHNNRSEAARKLGVSRALLYKKMKQFGLSTVK